LLPWWSVNGVLNAVVAASAVVMVQLLCGQLAHGGSMGYGAAVAAHCREDGEAVAAVNGGTLTAMVGARGSFAEAANLFIFLKKILNLWFLFLCN